MGKLERKKFTAVRFYSFGSFRQVIKMMKNATEDIFQPISYHFFWYFETICGGSFFSGQEAFERERVAEGGE